LLTTFLAGLRFHPDGAGLQGFAKWKEDVAAIAPHPNIYAKLGGHGMPAFGFGWADQPRPPSSEEVAGATLPFYGHLLDALPASRCMFEVRDTTACERHFVAGLQQRTQISLSHCNRPFVP